jgi:molecular chaperone DnaJ
MTALATRPLTAAWAVAARAVAARAMAISARPFRTCSKTCSAISWAGAAAAAAGASRAARGSDLRYNLRVTLEEAFQGRSEDHQRADLGHLCTACNGTGAEGGSEPTTCPTCSGMGKVRAQQGFFTVERTCPTCNGRARSSRTPARPATVRAGRKGTRAVGQHPGRRRDRHPHPSGWRGRGRSARRPGGRSLYLHRGQGTRDLPARRRQTWPAGAGLDGHRRPWAARSRCRPSTAAAAASRCPAGSQTGKQMRLRGKGMPPCATAAAAGRHADRTGGGNPGQPDHAAEGIAARVRGIRSVKRRDEQHRPAA